MGFFVNKIKVKSTAPVIHKCSVSYESVTVVFPLHQIYFLHYSHLEPHSDSLP